MYKLYLSLVTVMMLAVSLSAQTVVLINGVPTKVKLEGDKIVDIVGEVNGHLNGFDLGSADMAYSSTDPLIAQNAEESALLAVTDSSTPAPVASTPQPVSNTAVSTPVSGNYFKFERNSALLSQLAINEIKDYASKIKAGTASSISLQSFFKESDQRSRELTSNRLEACKKYFEVNGVDVSMISTEMIPNDTQSDKVSITLR